MVIVSNVIITQAASNSGNINSTVKWEVDNGTLRITGYEEIARKDNEVYSSWNDLSGQIVNIEIGEGITKIGRMAFWGFDRLTNISFPSTLEVIEDHVFYGCYGLKSIKFPYGLKAIGEEVFESCYYLENISIPDSVVYIGSDAFEDTPWYKNQPDGLVYAGKVLLTYKGSIPENSTIAVKDGTKGIADCNTHSVLGYSSTNVTNIILPSSFRIYR